MKKSVLFEEGKERIKKQIALFRKKIVVIKRDFEMIIIIVCSFLFLVTTVVLYDTYVPNDTLSVTFYDVGQGDGIFIQSGSKTRILIDGGPSLHITKDIFHDISFFERDIDLIATTHADKDHILGALNVLENMKVKRVARLHASSVTELDEEYMRTNLFHISEDMYAGDSIDIGGDVRITILLPYKGESFSEKQTNESSQVILLTKGDYSFLFTGDLPEEREHLLIDGGLLPEHITVLKAGHHGSKGSTGNALLSFTHPDFVVISSGKNNNYGHPSKETLERVKRMGSHILRTDTMGNILFTLHNESLEVSTSR